MVAFAIQLFLCNNNYWLIRIRLLLK